MCKGIYRVILVLLFSVLFVQAATANVDFYVSPSGDDSASGSRSRPFATLARARDAWTTTGIQDGAGNSGSFLGHQIEGRARWFAPGLLSTFEGGFARLWLGEFARIAPNGHPDQTDPFFVYAQVTMRF